MSRELDAPIATKIMDLKIHWQDHPIEKELCFESNLGSHRFLAPVPLYSTDISAAIQIIPKFLKRKIYPDFMVMRNGSNEWRVHFADQLGQIIGMGYHVELATAICIAALDVIEQQKMFGDKNF